MKDSTRYNQARNITLLGAIANAILGILKLLGGIFYHSHALIADGIHSFSDLLADMMVLLAARYGSQDADESHPYGHQRIETVAVLMLSLLLILAGGGIAWDAANELINQDPYLPDGPALTIAIAAIIINEILFYYTHQIGKRIQSNLIIANAWHRRSDTASSGIVALGLVGSLVGFPYLDAIAAIIVALMIVKIGIHYGWNSIKELIDTAAHPQLMKKIRDLAQSVCGVKAIHQLRSRSMGQDILVDVHILVSPYISVSEGHFIAQQVHRVLVEKVEGIKEVIVHVDPEDDEVNSPSLLLPNRKKLQQELFNFWQKKFPFIASYTIHYLNGMLIIDLIGHTNTAKGWEDLKEHIQEDVKDYPYILEVRLLTDTGSIPGIRRIKDCD